MDTTRLVGSTGRPARTADPRTPVKQDRVLRLIALLKFCKAALLVAVGLGALELLQPGVAARAQHWVAALATSSDRRAVQQLIAQASGLSPGRLEALSIAAFFYAGLFTIEGVGLWRAKRWAEYLTVIATMSFVPFEVLELTRRVSLPRLAAVLLNVVVVTYLIYRLRRPRADGRATAGSAA